VQIGTGVPSWSQRFSSGPDVEDRPAGVDSPVGARITATVAPTAGTIGSCSFSRGAETEGWAMADDVHDHIEALVAEEHKLWEHESSGNGSDSDRKRLAEIKVELDRYWDLLRRRRSAAEAGGDPDEVQMRSEGTVEGYLQ
jgi:hypothetical protein